MNSIRKKIFFFLVGALAVSACTWIFTSPPVKLYEVSVNLVQNGIKEDNPAIEKKLNSTALLHRIIYRLSLNAPVYAAGKDHDPALFNSSPIKITTDTARGFEAVTLKKLSLNDGKILMDNSTYNTGKWVNTPYGKLLFSNKNPYAGQNNAQYYFSLIPLDAATRKLEERITMTALNGSGESLKLAVSDESPAAASAVLMALIYNYNYNPIVYKSAHAVQKPSKTLEDSIALVETSLLSMEKKEQTTNLQKDRQALTNIYSQLLLQREKHSLMSIVPRTRITPHGTLAIAGKPLIFNIPSSKSLIYLEILMGIFVTGIILVLFPGIKARLPVFKPDMLISPITRFEERKIEPLPELPVQPAQIPVSSNPPVKKKRISEPSGLLQDIASIPSNNSIRTAAKAQFPALTPKPEKSIIATSDNEITIAEQFRVIGQKLDQIDKRGPKKILVTSLFSGQGKSFIASNLALSLALGHKKTLLIDMDLYLASITRKLAPKPQAGISDYLEGKANLNSIIHRNGISKELSFITTGKRVSAPSALVENDRISLMLELLAERFEHIIIDLPPVSLATDVYKVSPFCDVVILAAAGKNLQEEIEAKLNFPETAKLMIINTNPINKQEPLLSSLNAG